MFVYHPWLRTMTHLNPRGVCAKWFHFRHLVPRVDSRTGFLSLKVSVWPAQESDTSKLDPKSQLSDKGSIQHRPKKTTPRTGTHPKALSAVEKGEIFLILQSLGCLSLLKINAYTFYVKNRGGSLTAPSSPPTWQNIHLVRTRSQGQVSLLADVELSPCHSHFPSMHRIIRKSSPILLARPLGLPKSLHRGWS